MQITFLNKMGNVAWRYESKRKYAGWNFQSFI